MSKICKHVNTKPGQNNYTAKREFICLNKKLKHKTI